MRRAPTAVLALSLCGCAAAPAVPASMAAAPAGEPHGAEPAAVAQARARAEAVISAAEASADVAWLADPARTGRAVGTPGNAAAAAWLAARFAALGLVPGGTEGFLQPFPAPVGARLQGENALALGGVALALEVDFQPFTFSDDGAVEGELVFAGYGISAPALRYDDYAGLDVKGKVVLVAGHFPGEPDPASLFRDPRYWALGEWRTKAATARDHGALAVLAVHDDWHHPGPDGFAPWRGQVSSRVGLPAARVTRAALARAGVDVEALARPIAERPPRPRSAALGLRVRLAAGVAQERAPTANVVALLPGADPAVAHQCVVVGAHYDHLGFGGESSLDPTAVGRLHPGADDNASGTAALLQIARAFREGPPPRRTVLFAAFSAEELGLLGSSHLVGNPPAGCPVGEMQLMINLDMVGRPSRGRIFVDGADTAPGLRELVQAYAGWRPAIRLQVTLGDGDGYGPSDHTSFFARGVPVLFLFTGAHGDYHRPGDTADKVSPGAVAEAARLAYRLARVAAARSGRLLAVRTPAPHGGGGERAAGYGAYLGTIPDFAERTAPGVLVGSTRAGSPADQAGLKAGDVLLRIGAQAIVGLPDLAQALRSHRPGDRVEVAWLRDGREQVAEVTLGERK